MQSVKAAFQEISGFIFDIHCLLEKGMHFRELVHNPHGLNFRIGKAVRRSSHSAKGIVLHTADFLGKLQLKAVVLCDGGIYSQMLSKPKGMLIVAGDAQNREHNPLLFHPFIANANLIHEVNPRFFHHMNVIRMVYNVHPVCLVIKYHSGIRGNPHMSRLLSVPRHLHLSCRQILKIDQSALFSCAKFHAGFYENIF